MNDALALALAPPARAGEPPAAAETPALTTPSVQNARNVAAFAEAVRDGIEAWVVRAVDHAHSTLGTSMQKLAVTGGRERTLPVQQHLAARRGMLTADLTRSMRAALAEAEAEFAAASVAAGSPEPSSPVRAAPPLTLSLIGDSQIDEEIELARIVQAIEAEAEPELRDLTALCSGLLALRHVSPQAMLLRPQVVARGLRTGLAALRDDNALRLGLMRTLGESAAFQLRRVYAEQAELLRQWGVAPAGFLVRADGLPASPRHRRAAARAGGADAPATPASPTASLERLVDWAQATHPAPLDEARLDALRLDAMRPDSDALRPVTLSLRSPALDAPRAAPAAPRHHPALGAMATDALMEHLFAQFDALAEVSPPARQLVRGLKSTGRRAAADDPSLWSDPGHPWWMLIDRLLAVGMVHDDAAPAGHDLLHGALHAVVARLQAAPRVDAPTLIAAADEVQALAQQKFDAGAQEWMADVARLQHEADRDEVLAEVRRQMLQQLHSTPVCEALQRFLTGPWTLAMADTALRHGRESRELGELAQLVDQLIEATAHPGRPVPLARCASLLQQAAGGLTNAGVDHKQAYAEVNQLLAVLRDPPPATPPVWSAPQPVEALPTGIGNELHGSLPTVPMPPGDGEAPAPGPEGWLNGLHAGVFCRLFLQGGWMTVQLSWVSPTRNLYVFHRRHGKAPHSLTRSTLLRLRSAGMAASFEDGFVVAQAMDTLAAGTGF